MRTGYIIDHLAALPGKLVSGLADKLAFKGIAEGVENSNFLMHTTKGSFILTLYEKRVHREDLPFFLGLMEHLAAKTLELNAIGVAEPVSVFVETYGTSNLTVKELEKKVRSNFRLKPHEIVETFDLLRPIYKKTASYGHFGRDEFPWEKLDKVNALKA